MKSNNIPMQPFSIKNKVANAWDKACGRKNLDHDVDDFELGKFCAFSFLLILVTFPVFVPILASTKISNIESRMQGFAWPNSNFTNCTTTMLQSTVKNDNVVPVQLTIASHNTKIEDLAELDTISGFARRPCDLIANYERSSYKFCIGMTKSSLRDPVPVFIRITSSKGDYVGISLHPNSLNYYMLITLPLIIPLFLFCLQSIRVILGRMNDETKKVAFLECFFLLFFWCFIIFFILKFIFVILKTNVEFVISTLTGIISIFRKCGGRSNLNSDYDDLEANGSDRININESDNVPTTSTT